MKNYAEDFKRAVEPPRKKHLRKKQHQLDDEKENHFDIYICLNCNRVFEIFRNGGRLSQVYYEDFPRLHLEKEICKKCLKIQLNH